MDKVSDGSCCASASSAAPVASASKGHDQFSNGDSTVEKVAACIPLDLLQALGPFRELVLWDMGGNEEPRIPQALRDAWPLNNHPLLRSSAVNMIRRSILKSSLCD